MLRRYPGWVSATFSGTKKNRSDPQVVGNGDVLGFWHVLGRGHFKKFRAGAENRKTQFPGAEGTFGVKVRPLQKNLPELRSFFTFCVLAERTPTGRKSKNTGFLGPFGLGQPLALGEIPGRKQKNAISRS